MTDTNTYQYAIIELMGHQKIAGRYSEHGPMHRIDVPDNDGGFRFTRLFSPQAIYSITFVDQETAITAARVFDSPAIAIWELNREIRRLASTVDSNETIESEYQDDITF
jgi:hypothetical protein